MSSTAGSIVPACSAYGPRLTGRRLELKTVPTIADLRARQLEQARATLREALVAGGAEPFRAVVESLAQEFDVFDVAAAAVKLLQHGDKYLDGRLLAQRMGIELPPAAVPYNTSAKVDAKFAALVKDL